MEKLYATVFGLALIHVAVSTAVMVDQKRQIEELKEYRAKMSNWATIMKKIVTEHQANGGGFRVSPETMIDVDLYTMFLENDMFKGSQE